MTRRAAPAPSRSPCREVLGRLNVQIQKQPAIADLAQLSTSAFGSRTPWSHMRRYQLFPVVSSLLA